MSGNNKIIILGAGGFGREVLDLIRAINITTENPYDIVGFVDDGVEVGSIIHGLPVLGGLSYLLNMNEKPQVALAIGNPTIKESLVASLDQYEFPTLIHPSVFIDKDTLSIGSGTIICKGSILTIDIIIGDYVTINLACTVGHDTDIGAYTSIMPGVNISGEVQLDQGVYVGTGATIINQVKIGAGTVVGAGAVVSKSLPAECTAVGIPAKPIKFHDQ